MDLEVATVVMIERSATWGWCSARSEVAEIGGKRTDMSLWRCASSVPYEISNFGFGFILRASLDFITLVLVVHTNNIHPQYYQYVTSIIYSYITLPDWSSWWNSGIDQESYVVPLSRTALYMFCDDYHDDHGHDIVAVCLWSILGRENLHWYDQCWDRAVSSFHCRTDVSFSFLSYMTYHKSQRKSMRRINRVHCLILFQIIGSTLLIYVCYRFLLSIMCQLRHTNRSFRVILMVLEMSLD